MQKNKSQTEQANNTHYDITLAWNLVHVYIFYTLKITELGHNVWSGTQ